MKSIVSITKILFVGVLAFMVATLFRVPVLPAVAGSLVVYALFPSQKSALGLNNLDMRMVFENAKMALAKAFDYPSNADMLAYFKLTQNSLQLEQPIIAGATVYTFPILNNQGTKTTTEQRMKQQDTNVIYQVGIFLATPASDTDSAWAPLTYPNQVAFGANAQAQYSLYQGIFAITINNDQVVTQWDVNRHLYQGETQQTAAPGAGSPLDEVRGDFDGYYPMEPNVTLIGSKDNVLQIFMPQGGITAATTFSRIVIKLRTIQAQNSTVVS